MNVLVTGASGFVGSRLVGTLAAQLSGDDRLVAWEHGAPMADDPRVERREVDLTDRAMVMAAMRDAQPDRVFHLAAMSSVQVSLEGARRTHDVNVGGTGALADALLELHRPAVVIFASTGEVYGASFLGGEPLTESAPVLPANPYARSKLAAEILLQDRLADVCPVICLRLLNHTGPGQDERFVVPAFAAQIARIESDSRIGSLRIGNLAAERDFLDVGDVIDAYLAALRLADSAAGFSLYNVASGLPRSIRSILDALIAHSGASFEIEIDPHRLRKADIPRTLCDPSRFREATGWQPTRNFDDTLRDVLVWWRRKLGPEASGDRA
jgi:GDP-4-dehydro-6-deoxy-D-mannose reductase